MKPFNKLSCFILAAGIFILVFNTLLGPSITLKYNEINGTYKTNKVAVNLIDNMPSRGNSAFTMDDIRNMQKFSFNGSDMAYLSEEESTVSYEDNQKEAIAAGINDKYNMFHQMKLKSGSFITADNEKGKVAVIDENLALELFNNDNVLGMNIKLFNQEYKIIGVLESDYSIAQSLTDSGYGSVYIPVEQMLKYDTNSKITSFEVRASSTGTTGQNISNVSNALASIGKNASDYKITDYNVENILISQESLICIFIPGIIVIILFLLSIKKRAAGIYKIIRSALQDNYFMDALRLRSVEITLTILEMGVIIALIFLIWKAIRFSLYIPPKFVPDELIDTKFFSDLFKSMVQEKVKNTGYIPTPPEMKMNVLRTMQDWNLYICLLTGFPLYYLGLKFSRLEKDNYIKYLLFCCIVLVLSMAAGIILLGILKMPVTVNTKGISVVFTFIFLSVVNTLSIRRYKQSLDMI